MRRMFSAMLVCLLAFGFCFSVAGCGDDEGGTTDESAEKSE